MVPQDEDCISPPPAYSEQEFDTKISQATDLSLRMAELEAQIVIDEDGWPRYDPAMFEGDSTSSTKGKDYSAKNNISDLPASSSGVKKRPLPDITPMIPNNAGPSNIQQTAPLHIARKSISKAQEAALETVPAPSQFHPPAYPPREPDPASASTASSISDHQTEDVPLYSVEHTAGPPDVVGDIVEIPVSEHFNQPDTSSDGTEEPEPFDAPMPSAQPLYVNTSFSQLDDSRRSVGDARYPPGQYLPRHQSMPLQNISRTVPPEPQRCQSTSYAPTLSQRPYQPLVNFNPNVAYGASNMAAAPPRTIRPRQPTPKVSFPLQYDPHALYNSSVSSRLGPPKTTPNQPSYPSYQQTRLGNNQTFVPAANSSLNPVGWSMRPSSVRSLSTLSTMSDASYGGVVSDVTQYPSHSNSSYAVPENQQWYFNR